jgi:hypothetical protein
MTGKREYWTWLGKLGRVSRREGEDITVQLLGLLVSDTDVGRKKKVLIYVRNLPD